jgi:hypothetical protein
VAYSKGLNKLTNVTRKAEKRTDAIPGAGTKRRVDEWMSFVVRQEALQNKLVWLWVHVNMLDIDRHRTTGGHNYIRCNYSEDKGAKRLCMQPQHLPTQYGF